MGVNDITLRAVKKGTTIPSHFNPETDPNVISLEFGCVDDANDFIRINRRRFDFIHARGVGMELEIMPQIVITGKH